MGADLADIAIPVDRRLVWGPLPSEAELAAFFEACTNQKPSDHWLDFGPTQRLERFGIKDLGFLELCARSETVELWFDPEPNAQLMLLWLLDYLHMRARSAPNLLLRLVDFRLGEHDAKQLARYKVLAVEITGDHLEAASLAWQAYRAPTPEAWFNLLKRDLSLLSQLGPCVLDLLEELPWSASGLGATEMRMLELVSAGNAGPFDVFPGHRKPNQRRVFYYWEVGSLLDGLARSPAPAVSGLDEGPFTLEMHDDANRFERYKHSKLKLTALGEAILARTEDFSRHNPIHRWWGGIELINDHLWRWDAANRALIAP
jgi:hypothetical protein